MSDQVMEAQASVQETVGNVIEAAVAESVANQKDETSDENSSALVNLKSVEKSIKIDDMGYEFCYQRIMDPDKSNTSLFTISHREKGQPVWVTCNGLLTDEYTIAKTEEVISEISKSLNAEMAAEKHWRHHTAIKSTFLLKDYALDIKDETKVNTLMFNLLTNISIEEVNARTGLAFSIINGYAGDYALQLNYGFITSMFGPKEEDGSRKRLTVNNIFVLDEFTSRLVHDGRLQISYAEVANVKKHCSEKIQKFKDTPVTEEFLGNFSKTFNKRFVKGFMELYNELPENQQNLFYASYIWSSILENTQNLQLETRVKRFVSSYLESLEKTDDKSGE